MTMVENFDRIICQQCGCAHGHDPSCPDVSGEVSVADSISPRSRPLHYGDVIWSWCSRCMDRTDHIYKPTLMDFHFSYLICLSCHPELKEEVKHE